MWWIVGSVAFVIVWLLWLIAWRLRPVAAYYALRSDLESIARGDNHAPHWGDWYDHRSNPERALRDAESSASPLADHLLERRRANHP